MGCRLLLVAHRFRQRILLIGQHLLTGRITFRRRTALLTLLAFYWGPVLAISLLTFEQRSRYLLHVQPFGIILIALALAAITSAARPRRRTTWLTEGGTSLGIVALLILVSATGLSHRFQRPIIGPDYVTAMETVAAARQPGEAVIVALPAAAYLALRDQDDIYFLAETEGQPRVARYTFVSDQGSAVDYWTGATEITSPGQLCRVIEDQPGAWVVVDETRLTAVWAYRGKMARMIDTRTEQTGNAPGGVLILQPRPATERPPCQ